MKKKTEIFLIASLLVTCIGCSQDKISDTNGTESDIKVQAVDSLQSKADEIINNDSTQNMLAITPPKNVLKTVVSGAWINVGRQGESSMVECPDVLSFEDDGSYRVLNDCYGEDIASPVTERGKWSFDSKKMEVTLENRKFISNYFLYNESEKLVISVKEVSDKKIGLCFKEKECSVEVYDRIPL